MTQTRSSEIADRSRPLVDWLLSFVRLAPSRAPEDGSRSQREILAGRWQSLPGHLRTGRQLAGRTAVACGATHGIMERCNFTCTSCYLSDVANKTPALPFAAVSKQLDTLRSELGSNGKVQITSGEVTLLPVDQLGRIIAYALRIGLDPMVMTNGQRLLQVPGYLPELMERYGLEKISFHIDTTQRGRPGMAADASEPGIQNLRNRFARLIRESRKSTGQPLRAAQTVTVTPENASGIPDIVRWVMDNADAFRIISFLPVAEVGRTEDSSNSSLALDQVWDAVCQGLGRRVNRHAILFGHTECNITVPLILLSAGPRREVIELVREGKGWDAGFAARSLRRLVPHYDFNRSLMANISGFSLRLLRDPLMAAEAVAYGGYRLWSMKGVLGKALLGILRGRRFSLRPLMVVVHKFMGPEELETELGRERLEACVFKLPVHGKLVSMCQMNATDMRRSLNLEQQERQSASAKSKRFLAQAPTQSASA